MVFKLHRIRTWSGEDVHGIGQNIVLRFIETVGYKVIYLGIDVELAHFEGIVSRVTSAAFDLPQQQ